MLTLELSRSSGYQRVASDWAGDELPVPLVERKTAADRRARAAVALEPRELLAGGAPERAPARDAELARIPRALADRLTP